jgi:hypothetical protein
MASLMRRPVLFGAISLFLLLVAAYSFSVGLRATRGASITGDEPFYLLTTQSLLDDGDLDLRQQYERASYRSFFDHTSGLWQQSVPDQGGQLLSPHDPGLSLLLIPGFAPSGLRGAQIEMLLLAATTFALAFVFTARESGATLLSWLVTAAVGLSATAFVYATEIYPEMPAALCLVLSLLLLRTASTRLWQPVALVLLLSALPWLSIKYLPLAVLLAAFYFWQAAGRDRALFVAVAVPAAISYVWFHLAVFGHLTPYSVNTVFEGASTSTVLQSHVAFEERVYRLWGLFIDRRFGIARWAPLLLLLLPALPLLLRGGRQALLTGGLILTQLLIATFVAVTMMGWWFPGRTLMAVLPLCPLPLVLLCLRLSPRLRLLMAALAVYTLAITATLVVAARSGQVTLAVDPFDLDSGLFQAPARLFPQYTAWGNDTALLTIAWFTLGSVLTLALYRTDLARLLRPFARRQLPAALAPAPSSSTPTISWTEVRE